LAGSAALQGRLQSFSEVAPIVEFKLVTQQQTLKFFVLDDCSPVAILPQAQAIRTNKLRIDFSALT
jgi:hypothetical protein